MKVAAGLMLYTAIGDILTTAQEGLAVTPDTKAYLALEIWREYRSGSGDSPVQQFKGSVTLQSL